jgi:hypothetical protein
MALKLTLIKVGTHLPTGVSAEIITVLPPIVVKVVLVAAAVLVTGVEVVADSPVVVVVGGQVPVPVVVVVQRYMNRQSTHLKNYIRNIMFTEKLS